MSKRHYLANLDGTGNYDHDGTTDDDTRVTTFKHDHRNRQASRTLPEGHTEEMFYDDRSLDQIVADSDPLAESAGLGQLKHSVDFEGRVTAYVYDNTAAGGGRLVEKRYFDDLNAYSGGSGSPKDIVTYKYDEFGRTIEVRQRFDIGGANTERVTTNSYDDEGRLTRVDSQDGAVNYEYDSVTGLLIRTYTGNAPADENGISGNPSYTPAQDDGVAVTDTEYQYDDQGRLAKVIVHERFDVPIPDEQTEYLYDLVGNLSRVKLPNGLTTDYEYDELNRLVHQVNYIDDSDGQFEVDEDIIRGRYQYELDLFGKRTAVLETDPNGIDTDIEWLYDNLGRLIEERYDFDTSATTDNDFAVSYEFDLVGNRLTKEVDKDYLSAASVDKVFTFQYDDNDRLLVEKYDDVQGTGGGVDTTTFYEYSNPETPGVNDWTVQTSKTTYAGDPPDPQGTKLSETTFQYNLQGRLKEVSVDEDGDDPDGPTVTEYLYNDDGIRVRQTVTPDGGSSETTLYVIDNNNPTGYAQVLQEGVDDTPDRELAAGEIDKTYTLGHDVIAQATAAAVPQFFMYDGHGSTRALLDAVAAVVKKDGAIDQIFAYDAYGNLLAAPGLATMADALTSLLYSGEQTDSTTGLQYLRARFYDPATGRFNRLDPFAGNFSDPQSLHKYLYTHGDPVNGVDPSGLFFGLTIALQRYGISAQSGFAALNAVGNLQDAIDVGQIALQFVSTGTVNPFKVAEVAFGLLPGSRLLSAISKIPLPLGRAVNVSGRVSGASSFLTGMAYRLDKYEFGVDILTNQSGRLAKLSAVSNRAVRRIGELGNGLVAKQLGLERVPGFKPRYHGIDQIYRKGDNWYIAEAKGGVAGLADGQLSAAWIEKNIKAIPGSLGVDLRKALADNRIYGLVTSTRIDRTTGAILDPEFALKHLSQL